ncbi:MAG: type II toxin-antitoxin system RelE/ParE family toxin [Methylocystis sp.]|nr:type II toxin-antitoxin system RelE/ParE family toxin [Methylocystis sp.]
MEIVWLAWAQRDLLSISAYYESIGDANLAGRMLQRIVHSASLLRDQPYLGRPSDSTDGVQELQVPRLPYLLPYRIIEGRIEILRVFHEAQDRPSKWQDQDKPGA